jgi:arylsulfatase A-like enzyme
MQRREFLWGGLCASSLVSCQTKPESETKPPNIILILADDLGYGHLGCYGQKIIQTPAIDQLAAEGLRFTDAYAGCCVCAPSRSALITGLHTGHTPVRTNSGGAPLPAGSRSVARELKDAGYATGIFGKWGLGGAGTEGVPTRHGFDEFLGPLHQVHAQYYYPDHLWKNEEHFPLPGNQGGKQGQYAPDVMHRAALDFLRRHKDGPFFLYLPSIIPHHEFQAPPDMVAPYAGRFDETPFVREDRGFVPQPRPAEHFAGMVARLDQHVGEIYRTVRELGIAERTLILFTSDNGAVGDVPSVTNSFQGSAKFRGYKGSLWEGGIRVPLIAWWPGQIEPGGLCAAPCASWDFLPTFAELSGTTASQGDGISLVAALRGKALAERPPLYWETGSGNKLRQATRIGKWKAVRNDPGAPVSLYNLDVDPSESLDLAASEPEMAREMVQRLDSSHTPPPTLAEPGWP